MTIAIFILFTLMVLGGGLLVVSSRNLIHAALFLIVALFGVAGYLVLLEAPFLAAVQVLVYIGAIAMLMIFAIGFPFLAARFILASFFQGLGRGLDARFLAHLVVETFADRTCDREQKRFGPRVAVVVAQKLARPLGDLPVRIGIVALDGIVREGLQCLMVATGRGAQAGVLIRDAEARRTASMIRSSSIRFSLTGVQVDWTTKTSRPRTFSWTSTITSPSLN